MMRYYVRFYNNSSILVSNYTAVSYIPASICVSLMAVLANTCIIMLILTRPHLRLSSNTILCSSCISALLTAIIDMIATLISGCVDNPQIKQPLLDCVFSIPLRTATFCIFTLHITLLSLERFYSVIYPFKYCRLTNKRNLAIILFLTWSIPFLVIAIFVQLISSIQFGHCFIVGSMERFTIFLIYVAPPITFFIPPLITFFVYFKLLRQIDALQRKIWSESCQKEEMCRWTNYRHMLRHRKVLFQMFTVLTVYSIAFIPFMIIYLIYITRQDISFLLPFTITYLMAVGYLFVHPILAVIFTASIKNECRKKLRTCFCQNREYSQYYNTFCWIKITAKHRVQHPEITSN